MRPQVNSIAGRLSLRPPQRAALEILDRVAEIIRLDKGADPAAALAAIRSEFSSVTEFEREFPSLCFALATGVGKTRLMGAFIAYLYQAHDVRNFFVLAPNLTIYNKLIADFTPNTPKYVFKGIAEFAAEPPEIITGDNYETVRATRKKALFRDEGALINIFNISKINAEVRGDKAPRIKRLSEYIGESYFDYLAGLPDLVLLMDESHRYRASAGVRAINELKPILGLELTATPQIEAGGKTPVPFKNVIYSYPLAEALKDGFVKEPAVATRENFVAANYDEAQLERLKLEDGVRIHENTKAELEVYARQHGLPIVKPFMLVVAEETAHAEALEKVIRDEKFFEGRYRERVITVHSGKKGEEADETVERLLKVESPEEPTEIVIHVNMLKEGWDVTNLYTILPLRAANSKTLVEQSIGRGLRLPYGRRVGVPAVDRLTIVAHDRFQAIIDEANQPGSIIRAGVVIGRDIPLGKKAAVIPSILELQLTGAAGDNRPAGAVQPALVFTRPAEQEVARLTLEVVRSGGYERLASSADLQNPKTLSEIAREVEAIYTPAQRQLPGVGEPQPDIPAIVAKTAALIHERSIDIPRITIVPSGEVTSGFNPFTLDTRSINLQPVAHEILIEHLRTHARERLTGGDGIMPESRPENYLVRALMDFDDVNYDAQSDLLYDLAGQMVAHLRSYLPGEEAVVNVLQYHAGLLAGNIHAQMQEPAHRWQKSAGYEVKVSRGFMTLKPNAISQDDGEKARDFRAPVEKKSDIRGMVFTGFKRCLYPEQKFQSDPERRFAVLLEDEKDDLKWFKPAPGQFPIHYDGDASYEPDFVVETADTKYLCEPKADNEMNSPEVRAKGEAAVLWCKHATDHEKSKPNGGKPRRHLLIPASEITADKSLGSLATRFQVGCLP